jgi:hypothetical protein
MIGGTTPVERRQNLATVLARSAGGLDVPLVDLGSAKLATLALHFWHYNFRRIHGELRVTPAMEAGITDHVGI